MRAPELTPDTLSRVAALRDPVGVVSIYADRDPYDQASDTAPWTIALRRSLRDARPEVDALADDGAGPAVRARLEELADLLEESLAPGTTGRGHAIFGALTTGRTIRLAFQLPTDTRLVVARNPSLWPLARVLHAGRPTGLVSVSRTEVALFDWRVGITTDVAAWSFDDDTSEWRRKKGPASPNPARAQQSAAHRDRFERRVERHAGEFVERHGEHVRRVADVQGWSAVVVAGDPRLTSGMARALQSGRARAVEVDKHVEGMASDALSEALRPAVDSSRRQETSELIERAKEGAHPGGEAVVGVREVVQALDGGRVATLLLGEQNVRLDRSATGRPEPDQVAASSGHLPDHLVERALRIGAEVVPLDEDEAARLGDADSVAALLRWRESPAAA